jgi:hypothetical protein
VLVQVFVDVPVDRVTVHCWSPRIPFALREGWGEGRSGWPIRTILTATFFPAKSASASLVPTSINSAVSPPGGVGADRVS